MLRRFDEWASGLDIEVRDAIGDLGVWVGNSILVALTLATVAVYPAARHFFALDVTFSAFAFVPALALGVAVGLLQKARKLSTRAFGVLAVLDCALGQFFTWTLVTGSKMPGATVMVAFPTMLAAYHGYALRSPPSHPFITTATVVAFGVAVIHRPAASHLPLYCVAGTLAIGASLVLGRISALQAAASRERLALREAVNAQVLNAHSEQLAQVASTLLAMQGKHHDAGNTLSGLIASLERLAVLARRRPLTEGACTSIGQLAGGIVQTLDRLTTVLRHVPPGADSAAALERVPLWSVVDVTLRDVRRRYRGTELHWISGEPNHLFVDVCGGSVTLRRILENLVINACQGDGRSCASRVDVRANLNGSHVLLEIADDGPGLGSVPIAFQAFHTTKTHGSGLGLYTCQQLTMASNGSLTLANRIDAPGAIARLKLLGGDAAA